MSEFKSRCLELLDELQENGEVLVLTKRGQPIARVVPIRPGSLRGLLTGQIEFLGDVVHTDLAEEWEADQK